MLLTPKILIFLEAKHLQNKNENISNILVQIHSKSLALHCWLLLDLTICKGCLNWALLIEFGIGLVEIRPSWPIDSYLPSKLYGVRVDSQPFLWSNVNKVRFEYTAGLLILLIIGSMKREKLTKDHQYLLLRYNWIALFLVVDPRFQSVVIVFEVAGYRKFVLLWQIK